MFRVVFEARAGGGLRMLWVCSPKSLTQQRQIWEAGPWAEEGTLNQEVRVPLALNLVEWAANYVGKDEQR